jgi:AcrR family transcriptional regulator
MPLLLSVPLKPHDGLHSGTISVHNEETTFFAASRSGGNVMPPNEQDMKTKILLAAKKLFAKQGFDGTTVRQICEEAGANVALVSYYFGGKENVFRAVFETFFPIERLYQNEHLLQEPVSGIRQLIAEIIAMRMRDPDLITILQQEIILMSPRISMMQQLSKPLWTRFRQLLDEGRKQGLFHFTSLDNTFLFVLGSIFLYKQREYFKVFLEEPDPTYEEICEQTCEYVLNGLKYQPRK